MKQCKVKKLLLRPAYTFYITCICTCLPVVKNSKIILFGRKWFLSQTWCMRLHETLESAVRTCMIKTFIPAVNRCESSSALVVSARSPCKTLAVRIATAEHFFFCSSLLFLFLSRNHLPKGSVCLSVSCVKNVVWSLQSVVYIDCFRTISRSNVRGKQRRRAITIFLQWKSRHTLYLSKISNFPRYKRL